jgi:hypothetical protein
MRKNIGFSAGHNSTLWFRIRRILRHSVLCFLPLAAGGILWLIWIMRKPVHIQDGFEAPDLSSVWISAAMIPESFSIQKEIVRGGRSAAKIALKPGDVHEDASWKGDANERDEIWEAPKFWSRMD